MYEYLKAVFQVYNSRFPEGQYSIDSQGNIYYSRQGQSRIIGRMQNIDYVIIGPFENNVMLQGKLSMIEKPGKYLLRPNGPELKGGYTGEE